MAKDKPEEKWHKLDLPIKSLVLCNNDFIAFVNTENICDWKTTDEYDLVLQPHNKSLSKITSRANYLEAEINSRINDKHKFGLKELICDAIASALMLSFENAEDALNKVETKIATICSVDSRKIQITTALLIVAIEFALLNLALKLNICIPMLKNTGLSSAFFWGSIGASISILIRNAKITYSLEADDLTHYLESLAKVFAGAVIACVGLALIKAGLIFPSFEKITDQSLIDITASFAFGFSEKLLPLLTSPFEKGKR